MRHKYHEDPNFKPIKIFPYERKDIYCMFYKYPTFNCQLGSISKIQSILRSDPKIVADIFAYTKTFFERTTILLDLGIDCLKYLKEIVKPDQFLVNAPYTNNTGSKMVICVVDIRGFTPKKL